MSEVYDLYAEFKNSSQWNHQVPKITNLDQKLSPKSMINIYDIQIRESSQNHLNV